MGQNDASSANPRHCFDNIKIIKYAKFDPNIPLGLRFMRIFAKWPQQAGLMLSKPSSIKKGDFACYHVVQELWRFLLSANERADGRTHIVIIVQTQWSHFSDICNSFDAYLILYNNEDISGCILRYGVSVSQRVGGGGAFSHILTPLCR